MYENIRVPTWGLRWPIVPLNVYSDLTVSNFKEVIDQNAFSGRIFRVYNHVVSYVTHNDFKL